MSETDDVTAPAGVAQRRTGEWFPPVARVIVLTTGIWLVSLVVLAVTPDLHSSLRPSGWVMLIGLAVAFAAAEFTVFHFEFKRQAISFSLSEAPLAVALIYVAPIPALIVRLVASIAVIAFVRRQVPLKLTFNAALMTFELSLTYLLVRLAVEYIRDDAVTLVLGGFVAMMIVSTVASTLVAVAISCYEGELANRIITELRLAWWLFTVNASFSGMVLALALVSPWLVLVAIVPISALWYVLTAFGAIDQRLRDLKDVHGFTGRVGRSLDPGEIAESAVSEAAKLLRADAAGLVLFDGDTVTLARSHGRSRFRLPTSTGDMHWIDLIQSDRARIVTGQQLRQLGDRDEMPPEIIVSPIRDETGPIGLLVVSGRSGAAHRFDASDISRVQDLTEQLASSLRRGMLHQRIETEARHDGLTGLPNRTAFERHVLELVDSYDGDGVLFMLMLDLDRFKEVNDTLGHHAGDELLVEFARRMSRRLGPDDKMARLAGDEFAIIAHRQTREEMHELANVCLEEASRPVTLDGLEIVVTASVGVAELEDHDPDAAGPMRRADIAMYNAKTQRLGVEMYRDELDRRTPARLSMLGDLRAAIESGGLHVHYQPKLDLTTGTVIGAEALVRWTHAVRGEVPPTDFVRVAEDTGLIKQLTDLMLSNGIGTLRQIHDYGFMLGLSVNLSTHDLLDTRLPDRVAGYLSMHGVDPALLTVEITESSLLSDAPRSRATINDLNEIGVRMSIDDFGTGYSSLSYLRRLPVSELKIDQSFVANVLIDEQDEVIVRSTIDLGHNLGLQVVAEGVENNEVLDQLQTFGCDVAQGYCISRPLAPRHFIAWLNTTAHPSRLHDPTIDPSAWGSRSPDAPTIS